MIIANIFFKTVKQGKTTVAALAAAQKELCEKQKQTRKLKKSGQLVTKNQIKSQTIKRLVEVRQRDKTGLLL